MKHASYYMCRSLHAFRVIHVCHIHVACRVELHAFVIKIVLSTLSSGSLIDLIEHNVTTGCQLNSHFIAKYMVVNEDVADFCTSFAS